MDAHKWVVTCDGQTPTTLLETEGKKHNYDIMLGHEVSF